MIAAFKIHDENDQAHIHRPAASKSHAGLGGVKHPTTPFDNEPTKKSQASKSRRALVDLSNTQQRPTAIDHSSAIKPRKLGDKTPVANAGGLNTKKIDSTAMKSSKVNIFQESLPSSVPSAMEKEIPVMICFFPIFLEIKFLRFFLRLTSVK